MEYMELVQQTRLLLAEAEGAVQKIRKQFIRSSLDIDKQYSNILVSLLQNLTSLYSPLLKPPHTLQNKILLRNLLSYLHCAIYSTSLSSLIASYLKVWFAHNNDSDFDFASTVASVTSLNLQDHFLSSLTEVIDELISTTITETYKEVLDVSIIEEVEEWFSGEVLTWVKQVQKEFTGDDDDGEDLLDDLDVIKFKIYRYIGLLRIREFFNVVVDYPDSKPAIMDLKRCMQLTPLRKELVEEWSKSVENRLLHQGAQTDDILLQYIYSIKCFRILDPTGMLGERLTLPTRAYLRKRHDTVRCVLAILMDESKADVMKNDFEDEVETDEWVPIPIDANDDLDPHRDILTALISIYEKESVFIEEFRNTFAARMYAIDEKYNSEREVQNLELIRSKFENANLNNCDIMLKDLFGSKRFDIICHEENPGISSLHGLIISNYYWPQTQAETIKLPDWLSKQMDAYSKAFTKFKQSRKLNWMPHLGNVTLEIETGSTTTEFNVTPFQATVILKFEDKDEWKLEELQEETQISDQELHRSLMFWVSHGIIYEKSHGVFKSGLEKRKSEQLITTFSEELTPSAPTGPTVPPQTEIFVMGYLQNLKIGTAEQFHMVLKMTLPGYQCNIQQLHDFLQSLVSEGKLSFVDGRYSLGH